MINIEKALEIDIDSICTLDSIVTGNHSRRNLLINAIKANQCLVAKIRNNITGFAILEQSFYSQGFLSLLIVHPDYRRRGIATALIRHIESTWPIEKLFTSTNKSNVTAQRMFEALGFVRSGYIENLDEGDPEIIYFKRVMSDGV